MGIYNCESTLERAIESIVNQTYGNWELIMCDDGSTDSTYEIAERYRDRFPEKIIILRNDKNMHLANALNKCLQAATGEYIARMDADDESLPERFEKQIMFLSRLMAFQCFPSHLQWNRTWISRSVLGMKMDIQLLLICQNPGLHPAFMKFILIG